ncbi:MAG: OmpA family protein [Ideonella sp.]|nr:OmpA family protein [Ideonella sp.]
MPRTLLTPLLPWLLLLGSCASPPKPPTVDESKKRPANAVAEIELQGCKSDLQNARITIAEQRRGTDVLDGAIDKLTRDVQGLMRQAKADQDRPKPSDPPRANAVYTVRFDFNSAQPRLTPDISAALLDEARQAPLIVLRGRTDGMQDTLGENRIARERASAVRDYLVAGGIDPSHIRATHQPTGDPAADNTTTEGRALNRRVEIEVYRAAPIAMNPSPVQP